MRKSSEPEVLAPGEGPGNLPVPADRDAIVAQAIALMDVIPDAPESDGTEILAALVMAQRPEELERTNKLPKGEDVAGRRLLLRDVTKRPSEVADSIFTHYLILECVDVSTGELVRWQTSSPNVVVPVCKLYSWGKLPAEVEVEVVISKRDRSRKPLNLHLYDWRGAN